MLPILRADNIDVAFSTYALVGQVAMSAMAPDKFREADSACVKKVWKENAAEIMAGKLSRDCKFSDKGLATHLATVT